MNSESDMNSVRDLCKTGREKKVNSEGDTNVDSVRDMRGEQ